MSTATKSFTSKSGAYIEDGPREYQLYANIPKSDALVVVLEVDEDCPGRVYTYFMRGGLSEGRMTVEEFKRCAWAMSDLLEAAMERWPRKMRSEE